MVDGEVRVVPANETSWEQLQAVFGERGDAGGCQCQWFVTTQEQWRSMPHAERAARFRVQTACGHPGAERTSGLVAFLGEEAVGWCAVEPRSDYVRLRHARIPWSGREEDREDDGVWALVCFAVRRGYRRRGVSSALARAAVGYARERGARAIEGYPAEVPRSGSSDEELFVGTPAIFDAAGFVEVSRPTPRRRVMRLELD